VKTTIRMRALADVFATGPGEMARAHSIKRLTELALRVD
jgi:hypothetical protein